MLLPIRKCFRTPVCTGYGDGGGGYGPDRSRGGGGYGGGSGGAHGMHQHRRRHVLRVGAYSDTWADKHRHVGGRTA